MLNITLLPETDGLNSEVIDYGMKLYALTWNVICDANISLSHSNNPLEVYTKTK